MFILCAKLVDRSSWMDQARGNGRFLIEYIKFDLQKIMLAKIAWKSGSTSGQISYIALSTRQWIDQHSVQIMFKRLAYWHSIAELYNHPNCRYWPSRIHSRLRSNPFTINKLNNFLKISNFSFLEGSILEFLTKMLPFFRPIRLHFRCEMNGWNADNIRIGPIRILLQYWLQKFLNYVSSLLSICANSTLYFLALFKKFKLSDFMVQE